RQTDRNGVGKFAGQERLKRRASSGGGTGPRRPAPAQRCRLLPCHRTILAKPRALATVGRGASIVNGMIDSPRVGLPEFSAGSVWLGGAGPGDPGLPSALALHALEHADIVVYDALVDPRILALAPAGAQLDFAGKRGGRPSPSQPDISARLIKLA